MEAPYRSNDKWKNSPAGSGICGPVAAPARFRMGSASGKALRALNSRALPGGPLLGAWLMVLMVVLAVGCDVPPLPTAAPPPEEPTPTPVVATPTSAPTTPEAIPTPSIITLTLWTVEDVSPLAQDASGQVMAQQLETFAADHPDIAVEYILKKPYGKGGILNFLLTASAAAPAVLPDVVVIDPQELGDAARAGVLQPLGEWLAPDVQSDLFPFALEVGRFSDQLMGVQFTADVEHVVYNTSIIEAPPQTWTDVLTREARYIFPAGGRDGTVNDATLIQYMALGGQLADDEGQPSLDPALLAQVLQFYADGRRRDIVPPAVLDYETLDDCWPIYLSAQVAMSNISSHRYLTDRGLLQSTGFVPVPTRDGNVVALSRGWSVAMVTADPVRQAAVAHLLEWLLSPDNNAAWNQAANHLPTRRAALDTLGTTDDYYPFVRRLLEQARYRPMTAYPTVGKALQHAVQDVLTGKATPSEAATAAAEAMSP